MKKNKAEAYMVENPALRRLPVAYAKQMLGYMEVLNLTRTKLKGDPRPRPIT